MARSRKEIVLFDVTKKDGSPDQTGSGLRWSFSGWTPDDRFCRWRLEYRADQRQFAVRPQNRHHGDDRNEEKRQQYRLLFPDKQGKRSAGRRIVDILRAQLSADDIAACTRASLTLGKP